MNSSKKISIIVPVYNELACVPDALDKICSVFNADRFEIIVVDDGSTDGTGELLDELSDDGNFRLLHHSQNFGKGKALRSGLDLAEGDVIAFCDSDLELNPEDLYELIKKLITTPYQVVYGQRDFSSSQKNCKTIIYWLGNLLLNIIGKLLFGGSVKDMETAYKVFQSEIIKNLNLFSNTFTIEPEITYSLLASGTKISEFPIRYTPRSHNMGKKIKIFDGFKALGLIFLLRIRTLMGLHLKHKPN